MWWIDVLIAAAAALGGLGISFAGYRWNKRRKVAKDAEERRRRLETDLSSSPVIDVASFTCRDDHELSTALVITNMGENPAHDVRVSIPDHRGAGMFNFVPASLPVLPHGKSATFGCRAKSIHFLNPYVFGATTEVHVSWNAPHLPDRQQQVYRLAVDLPPNPIYPIVELHDWEAFLHGNDHRFQPAVNARYGNHRLVHPVGEDDLAR